MMALIIKNYFFILLTISSVLTCLFAFGLYAIAKMTFKPNSATIKPKPMNDSMMIKPCASDNIQAAFVITSNDIHSIAGENVFATQLDLARAYIEAGREKLAKKILQHIIEQGEKKDQQDAIQLMTYLSDYK